MKEAATFFLVLVSLFVLFPPKCDAQDAQIQPMLVDTSFEYEVRSPEGWHPFLNGYTLSFSTLLAGLQSIALRPADHSHRSHYVAPTSNVYGFWQHIPVERIPSELHQFGATLSLWYHIAAPLLNDTALRIDVDVTYADATDETFTFSLLNNNGHAGSCDVTGIMKDLVTERKDKWSEEWLHSCVSLQFTSKPIRSITLFLIGFLPPPSPSSFFDRIFWFAKPAEPTIYIDLVNMSMSQSASSDGTDCGHFERMKVEAPDACQDVECRYTWKKWKAIEPPSDQEETSGGQTSSSSKICMATHLLMSQLDQLEAMAKRWKGKLSVAIFVENPEEVNIPEETFPAIYEWTTLHIIYPTDVKRQSKDWEEYPINLLRKVARQGCGTEFILDVDVGFLPSDTLETELSYYVEARKENSDDFQKEAVVITSFVSSASPSIETLPTSTKDALVAIEDNTLIPIEGQKALKSWREQLREEHMSTLPLVKPPPFVVFLMTHSSAPMFPIERLSSIDGLGIEKRVVQLDLEGYVFIRLAEGFVVASETLLMQQEHWKLQRNIQQEGITEPLLRQWKNRYAFTAELIADKRAGSPKRYDVVPVSTPIGVRKRKGLMGMVVYMYEVDPAFLWILLLGSLFATFVVLGKELFPSYLNNRQFSNGNPIAPEKHHKKV